MYKAKDLRDQSLEELEVTCQEARRRLFDLNNQFKAHKKREKPHELRVARHDIARLLTVMTEKCREKENQVH